MTGIATPHAIRAWAHSQDAPERPAPSIHFAPQAIRPIARLGYYDYTSIDSRFEMIIPSTTDLHLAGLEGSRTT